ncbi:MAG: hypothetical protein RIM33_18420 [Alphaproteobacteria bacterium]
MTNDTIDPNEHPIRANKGIVTVVVTLGLLIILGLGGLVYGMAMKAQGLGSEEATSSTAPAAPQIPVADSGAIQSVTNGPSGRILIEMRDADGRETVRVYDRDGAFLFEIDPGAGQ